jgi:putative sigma-54 modulation protein
MQISVTFRQLEPSEALKNYVTDRLGKFKRYLEGPVEAHVVWLENSGIWPTSLLITTAGSSRKKTPMSRPRSVMDKIDMQLKKFRTSTGPKGPDRQSAALRGEADETPCRRCRKQVSAAPEPVPRNHTAA